MAGLGDLFPGGEQIENIFLWSVLGNVVNALLAPEMNELQQLSFKILSNEPLSPADAASAVVRNFLTPDEAAGEASLSGVDADRLAILTHLAGDAPAPGDLATALRRKIIPESGAGADSTSFDQGIAEGRLADKWAPLIKALSEQWPTPDDALNALLVGYLQPADAKALYEQLGGNPDYFDMLYFIHGTAPTPTELLQLWNRGIIPEDSGDPNKPGYTQGFLQGPWRNEWLEPYKALREYVPPPRTVVAMFKEGSYTRAEAAAVLAKSGLSTDSIAHYLDSASHQKTAAAKELTEAQLVAMYEGHLISRGEVETLLEALRYDAHDAAMILDLADLRTTIASVNSAVSHVRSLYTAHKISKGAAAGVLAALQVPADQVTRLMGVWDLQAAVNVKQLTEAQVADAFALGILTQDAAERELVALGYTPLDAWTLLSIKHKAPLPGKPAAGPNPVGTIP